MVGQVLEYEAKTILRRGIAKGESRGIRKGIREGMMTTLFGLARDKLISIKDAALRAGMTEEEFQRQMMASLQ